MSGPLETLPSKAKRQVLSHGGPVCWGPPALVLQYHESKIDEAWVSAKDLFDAGKLPGVLRMDCCTSTKAPRFSITFETAEMLSALGHKICEATAYPWKRHAWWRVHDGVREIRLPIDPYTCGKPPLGPYRTVPEK